jgi:hypothetical protein
VDVKAQRSFNLQDFNFNSNHGELGTYPDRSHLTKSNLDEVACMMDITACEYVMQVSTYVGSTAVEYQAINPSKSKKRDRES